MAEPGGGQLRLLAYADSKIFSGAEALFCDLVAELATRSDIQLRSVAPHENTALTERLREATGALPVDVPAQPLPIAAVHLYDPRRRRRVRRALAEVDFDAALVNLPSAEYGATPLLDSSLAGRSIGLLHIVGSPRALGFRFGWLRQRLAHRALRRLDAACVLTESAARAYRALWAGRESSAVEVVRPSKPTIEPVDREAARSALGLPAGTIVGIAGRVSFKQKGQDTFVDAAALLLDRRPDLSFAVAGEGRDLDRLGRLLRARGIEGKFSLLGQVDPIERFLCAVDAIAIPSAFEGLPLIALEALALGIPGVATSADGLQDIWPAAWRIAERDPDALASRMGQVLDASPEDRHATIEEGRRLMEASTSENPARELEAQILSLGGRRESVG
jgi:glycosyltransferase involved in cell wall biosynthesis